MCGTASSTAATARFAWAEFSNDESGPISRPRLRPIAEWTADAGRAGRIAPTHSNIRAEIARLNTSALTDLDSLLSVAEAEIERAMLGRQPSRRKPLLPRHRKPAVNR
jgi:hypothetical protein